MLAIAIVAVAHSFWILIGKNPSGDACDGRLVSFVLRHGPLAIESLCNAIVAGIDDFDSVPDSLFSAFNMLVLGVFQIDTVRALGRVLISLTISLL